MKSRVNTDNSKPVRGVLASSTATMIVATLAGIAAPAWAQGRMYAVDSSRALFEINYATGAKTSIGAVTSNAGTTGGLAYDPASRVVYLTSTSLDSLFTLDLATATATLVGPYGDTAVVMHGLEWNDREGMLYGMSTHNNGLYRINPATGAATLIGLSGQTSFSNLGYNSTTGVMYVSNSGADALSTIDLTTGAITPLGFLNGPTNPNGLAYNRDSQTMYLICNNTDSLYTLNLQTGAATLVGSTGSGNLLGLVYIPQSTPSCIADVDDGSGTGTRDGGVDINDLLYFLDLFDSGNIAADVDNGTSTGTPDGGVDINDLLYYLLRFDAGC